jgi:hypothetical protein
MPLWVSRVVWALRRRLPVFLGRSEVTGRRVKRRDRPIPDMAISKDISLPTGPDVFRMPSLESYTAAF